MEAVSQAVAHLSAQSERPWPEGGG
jgi:hypothetical protein